LEKPKITKNMSVSRCVEQPALYLRSAAPLPHTATPSSGHPPLPERPDFRLPERPDFRLPERPDSLLLGGGLLERPVSPDDPTYATIGENLFQCVLWYLKGLSHEMDLALSLTAINKLFAL
jgi:hypothetical protein